MMNNELSISEVLKLGIDAQKAGKLKEADRCYTAILKVQPNHPDANHKMGILAVGVKKIQAALPFFRAALEASPKIEKFWQSYIDALIQLGKIEEATALLNQAEQTFIKNKAFDQLHTKLDKVSAIDTMLIASQDLKKNQYNILDHLKLPQAIKLAKKKSKDASLDEAINIYKDILEKFPKNKKALHGVEYLSRLLNRNAKAQDPPPNQMQSLIVRYNKGQLHQALSETHQLLQLFPRSAVLFNLLGAANHGLGQLDTAITAYRKATIIKPDYADAYYNMGVALKAQGKLDNAIDSYKKAINIKLDYAEAYNATGIVLKAQGRLNEALEAYKKAVFIKPDYAEAYNNIGNIFKDQGNSNKAIEAYNNALKFKPHYAEASHMLFSLTEKRTNAAPKRYVENLFDGYAPNFETSLVEKLEYNTPRTITDILLKINENKNLGSILDLGCGTGLTGLEIRKFCSKLEGIDLSNSMINQAKHKNAYDKLSKCDIFEYLCSSDLVFDCFIATDVFIYVGELSEIFHLIKKRNKKSGKLAFSTEHTNKDGFHLEKSGRYSHSKKYIEDLCRKFDYSISYFSKINLRKDKGTFIIGGIYVLDF